MLQRIVLSSLLAGGLAGILLSLFQQHEVLPLIYQAEMLEQTAYSETPVWSPDDGLERNLFTVVSNVATAVGFSLLLTSAFSLRQRVDWRQGLLWGGAGFAVFFLLPGLGLPPELPGSSAGALESRQIWWLLAVVCSASGLAMLALQNGGLLRLAGFALLILPHAIGAPQGPAGGETPPADMVDRFYWATLQANGLFWAVLGILSATFFARLGIGQGRL